MSEALDDLLAAQGGVATTGQLLRVLGRAAFESGVAAGTFAPVWTGVYSRAEPDTLLACADSTCARVNRCPSASEPPLLHTDSTSRTPSTYM